MRLALTAAALVVAAGTAFAQTSATTPNSAGTTAATPSQVQTGTTPSAGPSPTSAQGATGTAQGATGAAQGATGAAPSQAATTPAPGRNSFTQRQAASRIRRAGYTDVSGLKKDGQGVWRGTAKKSGSQVGVSLDYKGNVVGQ